MSLFVPFNGRTSVARVTRDVTGSAIVTNQEAQEWCKTDADLTDLIDQVTDYAETYCSLAMREQDVTVKYVEIGIEFDLPIKGCTAITEFKDADGNDVTDYTLIGDTIMMVERVKGPHTIVYEAHAPNVAYKLAILKLVLTHFEDRQDNVMGSVSTLSNSSKSILRPFRKW